MEADRNRRLRRVDWRVLLPISPPRRAVCFADADLAACVAEIAELVPFEKAPVDTCDLAVVVDPSAATLLAAFRSLRPGGACYAECRGFLRGSPRRVRKALEAAGFVDADAYWFWPASKGSWPRFWLPLGARPALAYFLAARPSARRLTGRFKHVVLGVAWRTALGLGLLRPVCLVARKPHTHHSTEGGLPAAVARGWNSLELGSPVESVSLILLADGAATTNKLVGFAFADGDRRPRLVAKLARVPEFEPAIEREAANLRAVQAGFPSAPRGIPRVLFFDRDWSVVGETMLGGRPLDMLLDRKRYGELAVRVTDWLCELADQRRPARPEEWWDRLVARPLEFFARSFGAAGQAELGETRAHLETLGTLPLVPEHRDCAPWNIHVDGEAGIVVHDWDSAEPRGLPLLDLVYFLACAAFCLDGAFESERFEESYRRSLDPATLTGGVTSLCERAYVEHLGLDPRAVRPLRALCWLIHSCPDQDSPMDALPATPTAEQALSRLLLQEELRRAGKGRR